MQNVRINKENIKIYKGDITNSQLDFATEKRCVAWDIETSGLDWRKEKIGTCQINVPSLGIIVVRIENNIPENLCTLLAEKKIRKIFHHAMFDVRFMSYNWNVDAKNIACTKIASKLLDPTGQKKHSLKSLLEQYLGISIDKTQRLSNWRSKSLTKDQLIYAAQDVAYLFELMEHLKKELQKQKLLFLANSCFSHIPTRVKLEIGGFGDVYKY